jgi:hypothetical protein
VKGYIEAGRMGAIPTAERMLLRLASGTNSQRKAFASLGRLAAKPRMHDTSPRSAE